MLNKGKYFRIAIILSISMLMLACNSTYKSNNAIISFVEKGVISFDGKISDGSFQELKYKIESSEFPINTLIISSGGGEVFSGMKMGDLVYDKRLKVIVSGVCFSSCANYIITASYNVVVQKGSMIGWHGGSLQPIYSSSRIKNTGPVIRKWQASEKMFFEKVGVNQAITILGMMPGLKTKRDSPVFSYDAKTLRKLGLQIEFEGIQVQSATDSEKAVQIFHIEDDVLDILLARNDEVQKRI